MGKASRAKKEREPMSPASKKILKQMKRESVPDPFIVNGKKVYFNPMKKILDGERYKDEAGIACTKEMVEKYQQFLVNKMKDYKKKHKNESSKNEGDK